MQQYPYLARIENCWAQSDQLPEINTRHAVFAQKSLRNHKKGGEKNKKAVALIPR